MAVTGILGTAHTAQVLVLISVPALLANRTGTECSVERIFFICYVYTMLYSMLLLGNIVSLLMESLKLNVV